MYLLIYRDIKVVVNSKDEILSFIDRHYKGLILWDDLINELKTCYKYDIEKMIKIFRYYCPKLKFELNVYKEESRKC